MEKEIWKDIIGFENRYQVSNLGRIKSIIKVDTIGRKRKEHFLKPGTDTGGYKFVVLYPGKKHLKVSRCVWSAFNGLIPEGMQINHINEVKHDNRLENLNLMTPKENVNWGTRTKRASITNSFILKNRPDQSRPINQYTLDGSFVKNWPSIKEIKRVMKYDDGTISKCAKFKRNTAYGFKWRYA